VEPLVLTLRCLLAAVFVLAGTTKLVDPAGSRRALESFGVPAGLSRGAALALPGAEVATAAALIVAPSARYGAIAAVVLLLSFIAGIVRANSQGLAPDCHCFGQLQSEPAGPSTIVRNVILAAAAVAVVAVGPWLSVTHGFRDLTGPQIAMVGFSATAMLLSLAAAHFWGERQRLRRELAEAHAARRPPGLPRGTPAPRFELTPLQGVEGALQALLARGRPVVLIFVSTTCGPCLEMLPLLAGWQQSLSGTATLPAIFAGQREDMERLSEEAGLSLALAQEANEVFELYGLRATPSALVVEPDGTIGGTAVEGTAPIEALIRSVVAGGSEPSETRRESRILTGSP
jgi:uncharacterized membrane protein YphA (DoxX/SURF4 family)/thiol-disulfide isomerase/thioredoxin